MIRWLTSLVVALIVSTAARAAAARAAPHSVVLLDIHDHDVAAELRLPVPEIEEALGRTLGSPGVEREVLRRLVAHDLHVHSPDGAPWRVDVGDVAYAVDDRVAVAVAYATLTPPHKHSARTFSIVDDVIGNDVPNHAAWIEIRSDFADGFVSGIPTVVGVTHYSQHAVRVERDGGGTFRGPRALLELGMRHIAEGTDHLILLLALLLPAPLLLTTGADGRRRWGSCDRVRPSVSRLLRVVAAFTSAYSLTLLVGALGWLRLPRELVESSIAASILLSAAHAWRPIFPGREAWVAGGCGLVHGLAFAGALAALHLQAGELGLALLGFNLGIAATQLGVLAMSFPWLMLLAPTRVYAPFRIASACLAALAAIGWIAQRVLHLPNPVDEVVRVIVAHPRTVLSMLVGVSVAARLWPATARRRRSTMLTAA